VKTTISLTAAVLSVMISASGSGRAVAQDQAPGADGDAMQETDHDRMTEGMDDSTMTHETQMHSGGGHGAPGAAGTALPGSQATDAYRAANLAMHAAMDIEFSNDADIDFARGMIGHHQGAIDMARIVLEHGEDPELRHLAEQIIEAQEAEIAFLLNWIAKHAE
jgi:uncharacterized protein (DUF305 family)